MPHDPEDYIHRIGRTARANAEGTAITFVSEKEQGKFNRIETFLGYEIAKREMPEGVGEGPVYAPKQEKGGRHGRGGNRGGEGRGRSRNRRRGDKGTPKDNAAKNTAPKGDKSAPASEKPVKEKSENAASQNQSGSSSRRRNHRRRKPRSGNNGNGGNNSPSQEA